MQEIDILKSRLKALESELEGVSVAVESLKVTINGSFWQTWFEMVGAIFSRSDGASHPHGATRVAHVD